MKKITQPVNASMMNRQQKRISVVIIAQDEAQKIPAAIISCQAFADEILVIDGGSKDATPELARELGCKVITNQWPGYAKQRNLGASLADHDWIFFIDADEVVDETLAHELRRWKESACQPNDLFAIYRVGDFMGQWLESRGEQLVRLYNRGLHTIADTPVHEGPTLDNATVIPLKGTLWHYGFRSVSDHVIRFNRYTTLEAETAQQIARKFSFVRLLWRPPARFIYTYIMQRLYKKGMTGLTVALLWVYYEILREIKLYELQRQRTEGNGHEPIPGDHGVKP